MRGCESVLCLRCATHVSVGQHGCVSKPSQLPSQTAWCLQHFGHQKCIQHFGHHKELQYFWVSGAQSIFGQHFWGIISACKSFWNHACRIFGWFNRAWFIYLFIFLHYGHVQLADSIISAYKAYFRHVSQLICGHHGFIQHSCAYSIFFSIFIAHFRASQRCAEFVAIIHK